MMYRFRVPPTKKVESLSTLLSQAWPEKPGAADAMIRNGQVRVEGRPVRDPERTIEGGGIVEFTADLDDHETFAGIDLEVLARGNGWYIVEKALGISTVPSADDDPWSTTGMYLGLPLASIEPLYHMPPNALGPLIVVAESQTRDAIRSGLSNADILLIFSVVVERPALPQGSLEDAKVRADWAMTKSTDGLAELQVTLHYKPQQDAIQPFDDLLELLRKNDMPPLGDRVGGGLMIEGGLRMRLSTIYAPDDLARSFPPPQAWMPRHWRFEEPEKAPTRTKERSSGGPGVELIVSTKTLEVMAEGHPWVMVDKKTGDRTGLRSGDLVRLVSETGEPGPDRKTRWALYDEDEPVIARAWTDDESAARDFAGEVQVRVDKSHVRREELLRTIDKTDLFRLVHGEADQLPGVFVDRMGPLWRATVTARCARPVLPYLYQALVDFDESSAILEARHLQDVRKGASLPRARVLHQGRTFLREGEPLIAREDGFRYLVDPWEGIDVGFFADQREERRRMLDFAEAGQRWLNLFCHTGAFSVRLVGAGATVTSVDISKKYLDWLEENLRINQLDLLANENVAEDARAFFRGRGETYDGIIVDPPTASSSEEGFWSVRRDYPELLAQCFSCLNPGGVLYLCRNDRKRKTGELEKMVRQAGGERIKSVITVSASSDFPALVGFPEGDRFEGLWVRT